MSYAVDLSPSQSENIIYSRLRAGGIPDPLAKFVTAQSGHETDGWTSDVYMNDNNAFGYGFNGSSYKVYPSGIEASVDDIIGYLNRRVSQSGWPPLVQITTADQYAQLLKSSHYYEDTEANYLGGILRWFNNNLMWIGPLTIGLAIFAFYLLVTLPRVKSP